MTSEDARRLRSAIADLHLACKRPDGQDDEAKATQLMEVYSLYIQVREYPRYPAMIDVADSAYVGQLAGLTRDFRGIDDMYSRVQRLATSAIADPRILGVIRETFGMMHLQDSNWDKAYLEFFEAFRSYQAAGNDRAVRCLRYVLLANMVATMSVDPFDSQEAKALESHPMVAAMVRLRQAYQEDDMARFDAVLRDPASRILDDRVMVEYLDPLLRNFRGRVLLRRVKPYRAVRLGFLAEELRVTPSELEDLLVQVILEGRLRGSVDQIAGVLTLTPSGGSADKALTAVEEALRGLVRVGDSLADAVSRRAQA